MKAWLYQMRDSADWSAADYRLKVWENSTVNWPTGKLGRKNGEEVEAGDLLVFWFAGSKSDDPGIHGWALITEVSPGRVEFRALPPSDMLKAAPLYSAKLANCVKRIRGKVAQGTMWIIPPAELNTIRKAIAPWR